MAMKARLRPRRAIGSLVYTILHCVFFRECCLNANEDRPILSAIKRCIRVARFQPCIQCV